MDISSINQQLLWGARCKCRRNITNTYSTYLSGRDVIETESKCEVCGHSHPGNRGDLFNPLTYMVTAYMPFIIEDRSSDSNQYQLVVPSVSGQTVSNYNIIGDMCEVSATSSIYLTSYPLSSYYHILLPVDGDFMTTISHFCFYDYISTPTCNEQVAGVINWDDPYTTLNESASSINEWYGSGQIVERVINYVLHKGLGLIED